MQRGEWIIQLERRKFTGGGRYHQFFRYGEQDSHCRGTGSRFQYRPERNREHCIITEEETQLLLWTGPERVEPKTKSEFGQPWCSINDTTIWWQKGVNWMGG